MVAAPTEGEEDEILAGALVVSDDSVESRTGRGSGMGGAEGTVAGIEIGRGGWAVVGAVGEDVARAVREAGEAEDGCAL